MKRLFWIAVTVFIFSTAGLSAQTISSDSLKALKRQNERLAADYKISSYKLELADLERKHQALSEDAKSAKLKADDSFRESQRASERASENTSDKTLVKNAKSSARKAESDLKDVKRISSKQLKLLDDISDLKRKIEKAEAARIAP